MLFRVVVVVVVVVVVSGSSPYILPTEKASSEPYDVAPVFLHTTVISGHDTGGQLSADRTELSL